MNSRGRLLILSPSFHGYWRAIEAAFARLGYAVSTVCYDHYATIHSKVKNKLRSELPKRLGLPDRDYAARLSSEQALAAIREVKPDRILVVKGDFFTEPFWEELDALRVPRTLWLYDELRRTRHTEETLRRFDGIASYSRNDVQDLRVKGYNSIFVPLAFDLDTLFSPQHHAQVTFIGARYPGRESLLRELHGAGVPVRAYGREWSHHWFDRCRTWRVTSPEFPTGRDLDRGLTYGVMAGSPSTLNIHGDQDGFTMRTFEAAGVGAVQLIDRIEVSEFYEPGVEVAAFSSLDELIELANRSIIDDRWGDRMRVAARSRTLAEHTFFHRALALEAQWD